MAATDIDNNKSSNSLSPEEHQKTEKPLFRGGLKEKAIRLAKAWWHTDPHHEKPEEQNLREQTILGFKFNRWFIPPAAVAFHFCIGSLYAWSVYNKPIEAENPDWTSGTAAITFSFGVALLGGSAAFFGSWLERNGPRLAGIIAAVLFAAGLELGALAVYTGQSWLLYIGYGIVGGMGIGIGYITPVSALVKWFPDKKGMAAGFAVCGFGGGSLLFSQTQQLLIDSVGVPLCMVIHGVIFFTIMFPCAFILRTPPNGYSKQFQNLPKAAVVINPATGRPYTLSDAIRTTKFKILWFVLLMGILPGVTLLSVASPIIQDIFGKSASEASVIVSCISGANLLGRLGYGLISDKIGRRWMFHYFVITTALMCVLIPTWNDSNLYALFLISFFLFYSCYGGCFSNIPAFISDMFGSQITGAVHGVILLAWSTAGVFGILIFTAIINAKKSRGDPKETLYDLNFYLMFGLSFIGFLLMLFLRPKPTDKLIWDRLFKLSGATPEKDVAPNLETGVSSNNVAPVVEMQEAPNSNSNDTSTEVKVDREQEEKP